jgi:hypothetical protein
LDILSAILINFRQLTDVVLSRSEDAFVPV